MAKHVIRTAADYAATRQRIQNMFDKMKSNVKATTTQAMADVALDCLGKSVERAPVEFGDLRGSGFAEVNETTIAMGNKDGGVDDLGVPGEDQGDTIQAAVGFTAPYAFNQHEHTEYEHPMGGQAKYLESVVVENSNRWGKHLVDAGVQGLRGDGS